MVEPLQRQRVPEALLLQSGIFLAKFVFTWFLKNLSSSKIDQFQEEIGGQKVVLLSKHKARQIKTPIWNFGLACLMCPVGSCLLQV